MKIGIIGAANRRHFWEEHLRQFNAVGEIIHTDQIFALGKVDACIILNGGYNEALDALRRGYHTFLVSRLIADQSTARRIHLTSEESGVNFMISNWSVFSSVTTWMMQHIEHPEYLHISRTIPWEKYIQADNTFNVCWTEELALCLKWIRSTIHRMDVNVLRVNDLHVTGLDIFIRFDNSSTANIHISLAGNDDHYTRQAGGKHQDVWCNVFRNTVRWGREQPNGSISYRNMDISYVEPAQQSLALFLKSIQQSKPTPFNGHDLVRFTKAAETVDRHLKRHRVTE